MGKIDFKPCELTCMISALPYHESDSSIHVPHTCFYFIHQEKRPLNEVMFHPKKPNTLNFWIFF